MPLAQKLDFDNRHLWVFTPDGRDGAWSSQRESNPDVAARLMTTTLASSDFCAGMGFHLGGWASGATDRGYTGNATVPIPGILTYNATTRAWANESLVPVNPPSGTIRDGTGVCVAGFGAGPLFVLLGGALPAEHDLPEADMANITSYDQRANRWLWQEATGQIPQGRVEFCAVGVRGPNGTHET